MTQLEQIKTNTGGAFVTPLRYPGGKGRLGPWLAQVMSHNDLIGGWYVEPYAGGAGVALFLLTEGFAEQIVINDADPVVYAFWRAATERPRELIERILNTPATMATWDQQKAVIETPNNHNYVDVGFAAFFLNRTNRSGILSAGVIGGKAQSGRWRLDARYNIPELCRRIAKIGGLSNQITVVNMDALDLLTDAAPGFPKKCLVYLDPPYYVKGSQLYRNHYAPDDHAVIAECVARAEYPVIVTYDDCPEIRNLYDDLRSVTFSLHYSTHTARPKASEALFYKNIDLPFDPLMTRSFRVDRYASGQHILKDS